MLQQHNLKHIVKMLGILLQNQTRFAILFLSLVLTACGGTNERTTPLEEPESDGVAPSLTGTAKTVGAPYTRDVYAKAVNKCNLGQKVAVDQTVLVQVSASESVLAPNVTIAGMPVAMSGSSYNWSGEFDLDQLPAGSFSHDQNIPYVITVTDSSGEVSDPFSPLPESDEALKFCDAEVDPDKCACYPEDISGVWKLAQKARAMGVGQSKGNTGDWSSTDFHLSQRDCLFDDTYTFIVDAADPSKKKGSFYQEMDGWTWLEPWQSGDVERCGLPQNPFDGSTENMSYVWDRDAGTLTLRGKGAHIALPRVANDEENTGTPVEEVVYELETANKCFISFNIKSGGPSPWWHFEIEKSENLDGSPCQVGGNDTASFTSVTVPPIFSAEYDGMSATDVRLDLTAPFSSDPNAEIQPTVTNEGTTFSVPASYFVDPDGDGVEDNPGAFAGFANNPDASKLYSYEGQDAGEEFLAAQEAANQAIAAGNDPEPLPEYYTNRLQFGSGGYIYFKGSVQNGQEADLYFKLEHFEVDAATGEFTTIVDANGTPQKVLIDTFNTEVITMKGSETGFYGVEIEPKLTLTANSIALFINTPDTNVVLRDIRVVTTKATDGSTRGPYTFTSPFSGGPVGDDPDTEVIETDAKLGIDGKLLSDSNALPEIEITNDGKTFMVPSFYFKDPNADGVIDYPGAYSGFAPDAGAAADMLGNFLDKGPLTFGEGGKITFTASVPIGSADVRFRLEKVKNPDTGDAAADANATEPSCTMPAAEIVSDIPTQYSIAIPVQGRRTFKNMIMFIDTPDKEVTISNIVVETSPVDESVTAVDCGSLAALYGDKVLDMTGPYGGAELDTRDVDGFPTNFFRVPSVPKVDPDTNEPFTYSGYAILDSGGPTLIEQVPAAFGTGGKITFTASIPALQQYNDGDGNPVVLANAQSSVSLQFKLEREGSAEPDPCKTEPSFTTDPIIITGAEREYTFDIPPQGVKTYQNFVMLLETKDTQVQISNVTLTTTPPEEGAQTIPETCVATPIPSQYFPNAISEFDFDGDGIADDADDDIDNDGVLNDVDDYDYSIGNYAQVSIAALFRGTYGGEASGVNTEQSGDKFKFPLKSADYGGWSNDNNSFYPMAFNSFVNGDNRIAFCASSQSPATVTFKVENLPHPSNTIQVLTESQAIPGDGVVRPYMVNLTTTNIAASPPATINTGFPQTYTSLQMYVAERDIEVTVGKVRGNWDFRVPAGGGMPAANDFLNNTENTSAEDLETYCDDFPNPDTDGDGIKDNLDLYPNDETKAGNYDFDEDGIDDQLDPDIDNDGIPNEWDANDYEYNGIN